MRNRWMALLIASVMLLAVLLPAGLAGAEKAAERQITDMAGRTMTVPQQIDSVFPTGPVAAIYVYTLAPEKLAGWNYPLNADEKAYIPEQYHALPSFGVGSAVNYEAVIAAAPTIALSVGQISDALIGEADTLARTLGMPVVCIDEELLSTAEAYRFLGSLLGVEERGERLAGYAQETLQVTAAMPREQQVRLYYGNGEDSLETAPAGSSHFQTFEMAGAINAAQLELGDGHRVQISPEQLLAWDPEVIIVSGEAKAGLSGGVAAEALKANPLFATLSAVQEDRVYGAPCLPFGWLDRPPGPNRLIGLRWLCGLLYPEPLGQDLPKEIQTFFSLFYHTELTDEQAAAFFPLP